MTMETPIYNSYDLHGGSSTETPTSDKVSLEKMGISESFVLFIPQSLAVIPMWDDNGVYPPKKWKSKWGKP